MEAEAEAHQPSGDAPTVTAGLPRQTCGRGAQVGPLRPAAAAGAPRPAPPPTQTLRRSLAPARTRHRFSPSVSTGGDGRGGRPPVVTSRGMQQRVSTALAYAGDVRTEPPSTSGSQLTGECETPRHPGGEPRSPSEHKRHWRAAHDSCRAFPVAMPGQHALNSSALPKHKPALESPFTRRMSCG